MDPRDERLTQELEGLKRDYERLRDDRVRTEQRLNDLTQRLKDLEAHALEEYGTADPEELSKLLEERRAANERAVAEYREHLQAVQEALKRAEDGQP